MGWQDERSVSPVTHLRLRYAAICRKIPPHRRRLVWGRVLYGCKTGPTVEDGPFEGQTDGGCGWSREVLVGVGVAQPLPNLRPIELPPEAGACERCKAPLSLVREIGIMPVSGQPAGSEVAPPETAPVLRVPSRPVARKMVHMGHLYAQLVEPEFDPGDPHA